MEDTVQDSALAVVYTIIAADPERRLHLLQEEYSTMSAKSSRRFLAAVALLFILAAVLLG